MKTELSAGELQNEKSKLLILELNNTQRILHFTGLTDEGGFPQVASALERHLKEFGVLVH